jgi:hypothetical protein
MDAVLFPRIQRAILFGLLGCISPREAGSVALSALTASMGEPVQVNASL